MAESRYRSWLEHMYSHMWWWHLDTVHDWSTCTATCDGGIQVQYMFGAHVQPRWRNLGAVYDWEYMYSHMWWWHTGKVHDWSTCTATCDGRIQVQIMIGAHVQPRVVVELRYSLWLEHMYIHVWWWNPGTVHDWSIQVQFMTGAHVQPHVMVESRYSSWLEHMYSHVWWWNPGKVHVRSTCTATCDGGIQVQSMFGAHVQPRVMVESRYSSCKEHMYSHLWWWNTGTFHDWSTCTATCDGGIQVQFMTGSHVQPHVMAESRYSFYL